MNVLILMDPWAACASPLEVQCKANIQTFLSKIFDWQVYYWHTNRTIDPLIQIALDQHPLAQCTNDAMLVYDDVPKTTTFYYAGFHANHCIFYNCIGIDKLFEITPDSKFYVIDELTVGLNGSTPVTVSNLVPDTDVQHYRHQILQQNLVVVPGVEPGCSSL